MIDARESRIDEQLPKLSRLREIDRRSREVAVSVPIAEQAPDDGNRSIEPKAESKTHHTVSRLGDFENGKSSAWPSHSSHFVQRCGKVGEIPKGVATEQTIDRSIKEGKLGRVGLDERTGSMR